jgi:hypothetical protein
MQQSLKTQTYKNKVKGAGEMGMTSISLLIIMSVMAAVEISAVNNQLPDSVY